MKRVVITGASGFIGSALAKLFLLNGMTVYGVGRNMSRLTELRQFGDFIPVIADYEQYDQLPENFFDSDIDVFYHLALKGGYGAAKTDYNIQFENATGACKAADTAVKIGCKKFVFAGSANEYNTLTKVVKTGIPLDKSSIYSVCKLSAEMVCESICAKAGIDFMAGRLPVAYGAGGPKDTIVHVVLSKLLKGESPALVEGESLYDIVYLSDIIAAFASIGENGKSSRRYYIGHRTLHTFMEIFTDIRNIVSPDIPLNFGMYQDVGDLDYSEVDLDALYNDTGFECKADFAESIQKTAKWVKMII